MPTYTFNNAANTNLRDANGANITATATVYALIGTIGTSFTLEKFTDVAISQGEMSVTTVGTTTRFIVSLTGGAMGLYASSNEAQYISSIYQGTKTTDTTERSESLATGVTAIQVQSNAGTGLVTVKVDGVEVMTVADGATEYVAVSGAVVSWSSATPGTIELGQGKHT